MKEMQILRYPELLARIAQADAQADALANAARTAQPVKDAAR